MRVQHRHIIYVQGYDPRGLAQYYRMFRTELRKFGRLYQLTATISRPQASPDGETGVVVDRDQGRRLADPHRLRFPAVRRPDPARPCRADLEHGVSRHVDLLGPGVPRHHRRFWRAHWRFATFITYPHFLLFLEALGSFGIAFGFAKGLQALGVPDLFSIGGRGGAVRRHPRLGAEIHGKPHLSALSAVRHDLDLGILAPPAAGMGRADRPLRAIPRQRRARQRLPRKSSSSATVRDRFWGPKFWRARSGSTLTSDGTARASCF